MAYTNIMWPELPKLISIYPLLYRERYSSLNAVISRGLKERTRQGQMANTKITRSFTPPVSHCFPKDDLPQAHINPPASITHHCTWNVAPIAIQQVGQKNKLRTPNPYLFSVPCKNRLPQYMDLYMSFRIYNFKSFCMHVHFAISSYEVIT